MGTVLGVRSQVDALVDHFTSFTNDPRQMPVVWHQSLLVFLQVRTCTHSCAAAVAFCPAHSAHLDFPVSDELSMTLLDASATCNCCRAV